MKRTLHTLALAAACLSLAAAARAGFSTNNQGPMSVHPEALPGGAFSAPSAPTVPGLPTLPSQPGAELVTPGVPAPAEVVPAVQAPSAIGSLERTAMPFSNGGGFQPGSSPSAPSAGQQRAAASQAFDGARSMVPSSDLDGFQQWYDQHTGDMETQQTKVRKAFQLAMSHPLAAAMKNGMTQNTVYKVDNSHWGDDVRYVARTYGDDPQHVGEPALVVFTSQALRSLSPEFLAAQLAKMWTYHKYRDQIPASAEKTYMGHSVMIRVFKTLTGSQGQQYWNYDRDLPTWNSVGQRTFEIFSHWYHWAKGFSFQNVRQGPYFLNKIMRSEGDPAIDADARGRMTLHQREEAGHISADQATNAQQTFDGFVSNEQ